MGTIVKRARKDGSAAYLAQISMKCEGQVVRESKTFDRRKAATDWIAKREKELKSGEGLVALKKRNFTLSEAIDAYVNGSVRDHGRTKKQVLNSIKTFDIASMRCSDITSADIVKFATELSKGRQPQTVGNYMSHLSAVFALAQDAWGIPLDYQQMLRAAASTKRLGITTKSRQRTRRPTLGELEAMLEHFVERSIRAPTSVPMDKVTLFAIFSTRRQEEICRITWADLDVAGSKVLVRDMKNPGEKLGNDVWCGLTDEALAVIESMPRTSERIFPFYSNTLSAAWTRAAHLLGIEDLHFHDLRHEGISWLFEQGWTIPKVAHVSGHRSWTSLKRYSHMNNADDKFAGWRWRPVRLPAINGEI